MAKKSKPRNGPKVILNPDVADDCDEDLGSPIPDDDGWVYLKRNAKAQEDQRAKKPAGKKRPR